MREPRDPLLKVVLTLLTDHLLEEALSNRKKTFYRHTIGCVEKHRLFFSKEAYNKCTGVGWRKLLIRKSHKRAQCQQQFGRYPASPLVFMTVRPLSSVTIIQKGQQQSDPLFPSQKTFNNDPSAGSPTETLLRLLLPLNDQV
jgi:hypothetical protein